MNRRLFVRSSLIGVAATSYLADIADAQATAHESPRPDPAVFRTGDLVWPKKPGAFVPYNSGSINSPEQDRDQWTKERDSYLKNNADARGDKILQQRLNMLQALQYREFLAMYEGDQKFGEPGVYSGGSVYVGHVGVIEVDAGKTPWVIEALMGQGVVRKTYAQWLKERIDQVVWLGRLKQIGETEAAKVGAEARRYVGKPYDFWNFDLNDDAAFYCSKLVWLSIYRSLGVHVDGNADANRVLWFSPKQLLYLPRVERIHDPGPYAFA